MYENRTDAGLWSSETDRQNARTITYDCIRVMALAPLNLGLSPDALIDELQRTIDNAKTQVESAPSDDEALDHKKVGACAEFCISVMKDVRDRME